MRKILYFIVIAIGLLQTIGYLTQIEIVRNLGILTSASPLPIVFTEVKGVEGFAADFYFQWDKAESKTEKIKITPQLYAKLKGPYNRRNIFGAAIAGGPMLPKTMWNPILNYGLCQDILTNELELDIDKESFSLLIQTRTAGRNDTWTFKTECE